MPMEQQEDQKGPSSSASTTSRWNPTKEQISVLEGLYKQGIRTPTAEQIQQIAGKLREYGSIEGKNVFYWFQNHKARQRQKQKQESIACFNRFLRKASVVPPLLPQPIPLPPPPCTNVVCSPYYFPQSNVGYYPQFQPVMLPGGMGSRVAPADFQRQERFKERRGPTCNNYENYDTNTTTHETLQLFPLHPTGILEERCSTYTESYGGDGGGEGV